MSAALLVSLLTSPGWAQDDSTRAAARALGTAGVEAFEAKDYVTAVKKLKQAYLVLKVPSLALWLARAHAQSGRLVEASELYLEATRLEATGSQASVQRQAQADAEAERDALLPRIPTLVVQVEGAEPSELRIDVDGTPMPNGLIGAKRPTDPGTHVVTVQRAERQEKSRVTLAERANQVLKFDFSGAASTAAASNAARPASPGAATETTPSSASTSSDAGSTPGRTQRTLGWVGVGVGGAGLILGGAFGFVALGQKGTLEKQCPRDSCPPTSYGNVDTYDRTRLVSTVGFIVGAIGGAAGITLLLTAPHTPTGEQASLGLWIAPGSAGLGGRFQ